MNSRESSQLTFVFSGGFHLTAVYQSVVAKQGRTGSRPIILHNYDQDQLCKFVELKKDDIDPDLLEFESQFFVKGAKSVHYLSFPSFRRVLDLAIQFGFIPNDDDKSVATFKTPLDDIC